MEFEYKNSSESGYEFSLDKKDVGEVRINISPETKQYIAESEKMMPDLNANTDLKAYAKAKAMGYEYNQNQIKNDVMQIKADAVADVKNNPDLTPAQKLEQLKKPSGTFAPKGEADISNILLPIAQARKLPLGISANIENFMNFAKTQFGFEPSTEQQQAIYKNNDFIRNALTSTGYRPKFAEVDIMNSDEFQSKYGSLSRDEQFKIAQKEADDAVPFANPTLLGDLMVTLPALESKFMASTAGGLAYLTSIGEGKTQGEAVQTGVVTAGLAKSLEYLVRTIGNKEFITNIFTGKATVGQTYDYLVRETGTTTKQIADYNNAYAKAIGKTPDELTTTEKIDAILQNSPVAGKYKAAAEFWSGDVINESIKNEEILRETFDKKLLDGSISRSDFIKAGESAKSLYANTRDLIVKKFDTGNIRLSQKKVDNVRSTLESISAIQTKTDITKVVARLQDAVDNPTSLDKLIVLKHDLNRLNLSEMGKLQRASVKNLIDDAIDETMRGNPDYLIGKELWKDVNKQYGVMKIAQDPENSLGKTLLKFGEKRISPSDIAKDFLSIGERGAANFNEMHNLLGETQTAKLEKAIIQEALKGKKNMSQAFDYIEGFEFASQEGQDFIKEVKRLKGIVPEEDAVKILSRISTGDYKSEVGWSDDLVAKMKIKIVQKIWSGLMSRLPEAEGERAFRTLGDVIKNTDYRNIKIDIKSDPELQQAFLDEQKMIQEKIDVIKSQKGSKGLRQDLLAQLNKQLFDLSKREKELTKVIDKNVISQEQVNMLKEGKLFPQQQLENKVPIIPFKGKTTVFGNEIPPAKEAFDYIAKIKDPAKQTEAYVEYFSKTQGDVGGQRATDVLKRKFNSTAEKTQLLEGEIAAKESLIKALEKQPKSEFVTQKINQAKTDIAVFNKELGGSDSAKLVPSTKMLPSKIKLQDMLQPTGNRKLTESQATVNNEVTNQIKVLQDNIAKAGKQIESYYQGTMSKAKKAEFASQKSAEIRAMSEQIKELEKKRPKLTKELP